MSHQKLQEITKSQLPVIPPGKRGIITGKAGSGKSVLSRGIVEKAIESGQYSMTIIIDPKAEFELTPDANVKIAYVDSLAGISNNPAHVYIYRVKPGTTKEYELYQYDTIFEYLFNRGKASLLYIDEAYSVCPTRTKYPHWLMTLYTQGRSKKVTCIATMQRPANVPAFMYTECDYFVCCDLMRKEDRDRMADVMGSDARTVPSSLSQKYAHWYYNTDKGEIELRKLKL